MQGDNPFGRICYPTVLNIGKQRSLSEGDSKCKSLSEGESNCNPQKLSACFVYKVALQMLILSPFGFLRPLRGTSEQVEFISERTDNNLLLDLIYGNMLKGNSPI